MSILAMPRLAELPRLAKDRAVEVLLAHLSSALDQIAPAELRALIATPAPADYWIVQEVDVADLMLHREVAVIVSTVQPTTYPTRLTGSGASASSLATMSLAVQILHWPPRGYAPIEERGRQLSEREVTERIADIYREAQQEVMMSALVDGRDVLECWPVSDYADSITADQLDGTLGRAVIEYEVRSQGQHPSPRYLTPRERP